MFRNQYDTDCITWSPAGRIHQIEYAMEAVKQGGCCVGIRGGRHVVLATLKRSQGELSTAQRKIFGIDEHVGVACAGLIGDGRVLCRWMRGECASHRYQMEAPLPVGRLVRDIADKSQVATARSWKRPYGVGLLVAGCDQTGPHLFQTCPSGNYYECKAMAIGGRSQASKTYLEKNLDAFDGADLSELVRHSLVALRESVEKKVPLTAENASVAVVGEGKALEIFDGEAMADFLAAAQPPEEEEAAPAAEGVEAPPSPPAAGGDQEMGEGGAAAPGADSEGQGMETEN